MCCFTEEVEKVSDTQIFARGAGGRQILVYSMAYAAKSPLAMVLPLPVAPEAGEDALRFISLEDCPDFFAHLSAGFYRRPLDDGLNPLLGGVEIEDETLRVHEIGDYEASYVPRPEDFGRLDERYRLPADIWLQLNHYRDYGFAVFKLKSTPKAKVHPMAFDFPRRHHDRLFFPTLHVHHRTLEVRASFDHMLYCQPEPAMNWHLQAWSDSDGPASAFIDCPRAAELIDLEFPCWRLNLSGLLPNRDSWVGRVENPLPA
jgi:hypothetical protein